MVESWNSMTMIVARKNGVPILACRNNYRKQTSVWGPIVMVKWTIDKQTGHGFWRSTIAGNYYQDEDFLGWVDLPKIHPDTMDTL